MSATLLQNIARGLLLIALIVGTHLATTAVDNAVVASVGDKFTHLGAFIALAALLDFSLLDPRLGFWRYKGLPLLGYGLLIEIIQYFLPHRSFDLLDLAADGLGIALYWLLRPLLRRLLPILLRDQPA